MTDLQYLESKRGGSKREYYVAIDHEEKQQIVNALKRVFEQNADSYIVRVKMKHEV